MSTSVDNLKNQIVDNQKIIDQLNADLARKTQEVRIIQEISMEINTTLDLDTILNKMLLSLNKTFEFNHSMVLLVDESGESLSVAASHGYADSGIGAKVKVGEGIIGVVAKRQKLMRVGNIGTQLAYLNSVKNSMVNSGHHANDAIVLPGLKNVQSQVAIPLVTENKLIGVLAVESEKHNVFDTRDELIITIIANQAASAIEKARAHQELKRVNENLEQLVEDRTVEIIFQKNLVERKNKDITDSIRYAKRMQDALLPAKTTLEEQLKDYFVFYKPKDIVSGDFYWVNRVEGKSLFSVIDCTGHGVPGAFLSIVAHANLQRSLHVFKLEKAGEILDKVNEGFEHLFLHNQHDFDVKDGMEMTLCCLDRNKMKLEFAAAMHTVYIVRNNKLLEFKGDKQPIGHFENRRNFSSWETNVEEGDMIYLLSDGYADQFGGPKGKKFKFRQLANLMVAMAKLPCDEQLNLLEKTFYDWKGLLEQVDDITVMGLRI